MSKTGTAITERKEPITPEDLVKRVQQLALGKFAEAKAQAREATKNIDEMCGGQTERLDREVVEQGRRWATRLAIIARRSSTSNGYGGYHSYAPSKSALATQAVVKKIYAAIGELEAVVATDVEIPLFSNPAEIEDRIFGGDGMYADDIRKLKARDLVKAAKDATDDEDAQETVREAIRDSVGEDLSDEVIELLGKYEIILPPITPDETATPRRRKASRRPRRGRVAAAPDPEPENDGESE